MNDFYVTVGPDNFSQNVYKKDGLTYKFSSRKKPLMMDSWKSRLVCTQLIVNGFDAHVKNKNLKTFTRNAYEAGIQAISDYANKNCWYVLHYDVKNHKYLNEIVFSDFETALKKFKKEKPLNNNDRVEILFSCDEESDLPNIVVNFKDVKTDY